MLKMGIGRRARPRALRTQFPALGLACLTIAAPHAARAEPAHIFRLPSAPVSDALTRFAVQAGVSVGGFPVAGCAGRSNGVVGVFTPSAALRRLLPAGCAFERVDPRAFRIVASHAPVRIAAPPVESSETELREVIVTAEKRREPLRGSPFAVSALAGGDVTAMGATSFAEIAAQFPGVAETNLGPGRDKIFIRGLSDGAFTGRTQSTVGLYLDDVPITYNAPDPDLRLADIQRVEVLRGPQGTLYGSGSIGGIVRIVPARPDATRFAASLAAEGVTNQHGDQSFGGEAMLNLPLVKDKAAIRGVAYVEQLAGYLDNPILGLEDVNRGRRSGARLAGVVELPHDWTVQAAVVRQSIITSDSQYTQGGATLTRRTQVREPHDNDFTQVSAGLSRAGSDVTVHASAAYIDHDLSTRYDATGAFDLAPTAVAAFDESQRVELWVGEATAASAGESRLRWLAGLFGAYASESSYGVLDASPSGGALRSVFARRDRLREAAVFGELTYDLTARLTATLGGRLFATWVDFQADGFDLATAPIGEVRARLRDSGFAPKLRLSYAFAADMVLYAQVQDGYRAGGFNVPAQADGVAGGPDIPAYRPDRLRSYEIGGEATLFDGALTVRASVFRADWRDVQTDQFRASGLPLTLNIGDGSNTGVEAELLWAPDAHWRVRLNALIDDPELTRAKTDFPARVDIGLPGVARRSGAFDVAYGFRVGSRWRGEVSARASYVGPSFLTFDGAAASAMGDYAQGRISASLSGALWTAQAYVANVTDERGDTFSYGNPFSRTRAMQATPLAPRTFGLVMRRSF
jgi:outer membrane receptor protein involved in Fe transport